MYPQAEDLLGDGSPYESYRRWLFEQYASRKREHNAHSIKADSSQSLFRGDLEQSFLRFLIAPRIFSVTIAGDEHTQCASAGLLTRKRRRECAA